ncbi:MAG: hypothetical protein J3K34DRAFT_476207 [Monoraphidium minutum]|nr:MAG: hypothetical protein J3K34DRAFT_476207 [Monoraphidium minutum]
MDVLKEALIKRMRSKFAVRPDSAAAPRAPAPLLVLCRRCPLFCAVVGGVELAGDVKAQEIISAEVTAFMAAATGIREQDLSALEDRIRARLSGETPQRGTLAALKRAQQEGDEWAKIYAMHIVEGKAKDSAERAATLEGARRIQEELARQAADGGGGVALREAREAQEREEEAGYFQREQAQLRAWEAEEEAKRAAARAVAERLKADRAAQLADRDNRRRMESELSARLAHEARSEFEAEEAARRDAKEALKAFLLNNEIYKAMKEEAKHKEWEYDKKVMAEYASEMERQERRRQDQLEALKAWQAKQEQEAKARPEAKRWIDPAIIDRRAGMYYKEAEEARAAEEDRRLAALRDSGKLLARDLDAQMELQRRRQEEDKKSELSVVAEMKQQAGEEEARREREKAGERAKKQQLKAMLESQMRENARLKVVAPMSDTEKAINTQLLRKVVALGLDRTGTLAAAARAAGAKQAQHAAGPGGGAATARK